VPPRVASQSRSTICKRVSVTSLARKTILSRHESTPGKRVSQMTCSKTARSAGLAGKLKNSTALRCVNNLNPLVPACCIRVHQHEGEPSKKLAVIEDFISASTITNIKRTELGILCAGFIKPHLVNNLAKILWIPPP